MFLSGHSPVFDESFEFTVTVPELAMLRIAVLDDEFIGDDFIGQCTVPLSCLRRGECGNIAFSCNLKTFLERYEWLLHLIYSDICLELTDCFTVDVKSCYFCNMLNVPSKITL